MFFRYNFFQIINIISILKDKNVFNYPRNLKKKEKKSKGLEPIFFFSRGMLVNLVCMVKLKISISFFLFAIFIIFLNRQLLDHFIVF
jgi:hypothetical protein